MKKAFLIISILFLLAWLLGYFVMDAGTAIHLCLALAVLFYIQSVITADLNMDREIKTVINI